ncbi:hypothetical protein [Novosphingobium beihaiensis]|uniref:DUF2029 domain-containing protein n=1 Tax=Novosphingobium beihaiensis TaxID=2930389 RepID=A0ABT0BL90_9SPHN|nr:hypothetical protein [Novosphingobium beihaiensis]MCJ2185809.1 hypothetical protein [Novosphingobium beihaiensis]
MDFTDRFAGWSAIAVLVLASAAMLAGAALCPAETKRSRVFLIAAAIAAIGLCGRPLFEDDHYRYLWDGYRTATAGSPYGAAPERFEFDDSVPERFRGILDFVNNPEVPTIYGPVLEGGFYLGYLVAPGHERALRLIWALAALAMTGMLLRHFSARDVALFAWNPLLLKETYLSGHPDILVAVLLCGGWLLACRKPGMRFAWTLGLAAATKIAALAAGPLLLLAERRLRVFAAAGAAFLIPYAPFLLAGGIASDGAGLSVFAQRWLFNPSPLYLAANAVLGGEGARLALGLAGAALALWLLCRRSALDTQTLPPFHLLFGAVLLVSPVVNGWYLLWGLPAAVGRRLVWPWIASAALMLSYARGEVLEAAWLDPFALHPAAYAVEWSAIALALAWDGWRAWRSTSAGR